MKRVWLTAVFGAAFTGLSAADFQPPTLIVDEMPVERVELVDGHPVDQLADEFRRLKMPRAKARSCTQQRLSSWCLRAMRFVKRPD